MRPGLARAILQIYGEPPVLDPMAGIGTTLVEAMLLGMDAIGVDYEKKFVDQANRNIEHVRKLFSDRKLARAICVEGDARDLSCLNNQKVNSILTSPPYYDAIKSVSSGSQDPEGGHLERQHKLAREGKSGYGDSSNIGHLEKYGSIVFSPPFADSKHHYKHGLKVLEENFKGRKAWEKREEIKTSKENMGNLSYGFGSILFSPPYCGVMDAKRHVGGISARDSSLAKTGLYSRDERNLGNIRNERAYLTEMLKVYSECYRVLKPGKLMIVVVKDLKRKGLTVPLGADTIKLCQMVGFKVLDIIINKTYFPSFWQLTHARRALTKSIPMTLRTHEYVMVFRKQ